MQNLPYSVIYSQTCVKQTHKGSTQSAHYLYRRCCVVCSVPSYQTMEKIPAGLALHTSGGPLPHSQVVYLERNVPDINIRYNIKLQTKALLGLWLERLPRKWKVVGLIRDRVIPKTL